MRTFIACLVDFAKTFDFVKTFVATLFLGLGLFFFIFVVASIVSLGAWATIAMFGG